MNTGDNVSTDRAFEFGIDVFYEWQAKIGVRTMERTLVKVMDTFNAER